MFLLSAKMQVQLFTCSTTNLIDYYRITFDYFIKPAAQTLCLPFKRVITQILFMCLWHHRPNIILVAVAHPEAYSIAVIAPSLCKTNLC